MLGHLAIGGAADRPRPRAGSPRTGASASSTACSPTTGRTPGRCGPRPAGRGSGFASAEALALFRLNALDASVKGALEHGL